ncbi:MAG: DUF4097 family beta strand repeat protein [Lachnospiraceae bacterium]|nr:DUF4097 family beta strand repeat protein [Lachnospiraceae bacterium]
MKGKYIALIVAGAMMLAGAGITFASIASHGFDFESIQSKGAETVEKEYPISGSINDIIIEDAKVKISPALGESYVKTVELPKYTFDVKLEGGVLSVVGKNEMKWFDYPFAINEPEVVVYIPEGEYESLKINNDSNSVVVEDGFIFGSAKVEDGSGSIKFYSDTTGDLVLHSGSGSVTVEGASSGSMDVYAGSGSVKMRDIKTGNIGIKDSSGSIKLEGIECADADIDSGSGGVTVSGIDAAGIKIKCSSGSTHIEDGQFTGNVTVKSGSGSVNFRNVNANSISTDSSSGSENFINTIASESFLVESGSGSVKLDRCDAQDIDINASSGSVNATLLTGKDFNASSGSGSVSLPDGDNMEINGKMKVRAGSGSIRIQIAE